MIRHFEESEETRKTIANLAKGNNSDMERWIQTYMEWSGLDDEHQKTEGETTNRSTGARQKSVFRSRRGARSARLAGEFLRIREARGEESREQNSEWAPVVPNMEAGGSLLQTTDPRYMVENIAMDDLEEK